MEFDALLLLLLLLLPLTLWELQTLELVGLRKEDLLC
jgi:hypothetical protein